MKKYRAVVLGVGGALVLAVPVIWWASTPGHHPTHVAAGPARSRAVGGPGRSSEATATSVTTSVTDPVQGWAIASSVRAEVAGTASGFARALLGAAPGGSGAVAQRCAGLATPGFLAWLATTPGAPVLALAAQPVEVLGVQPTIDDWAPGEAGVSLGVTLRAGASGSPAFLAFDVHVVAQSGRWLVDGIEL